MSEDCYIKFSGERRDWLINFKEVIAIQKIHQAQVRLWMSSGHCIEIDIAYEKLLASLPEVNLLRTIRTEEF